MARNRDRYGERGNYEEQRHHMGRQGGGRYQEGQGRGQHQGERFSGGQQGGWSGSEYGRGQGAWRGSEYGGRGQEGWSGSDYGERGQSGYGQAGEYDEWSRDRDFSARGGRGYEGGFGGYGYAGERTQGQGERGFWDKASDEVSSWLGDENAERRRRQDQYRGRGPKGYVRSDERIREDINDRLTDDWSLDATDIDVQVSEREVTLTGEVASRADKRRAEDLAESVSGVTNVQNNLRIRQQSTGGTPSI